MSEDKTDAPSLSLDHETGTQLFLQLIEAIRPLIDNSNEEVLDWDHLVDWKSDEVADFNYLNEVVPQVIRELAEACRSNDWCADEGRIARRVFCKHLLVQLRLRTTAVADFVAEMTHPDEDVHRFLNKQSWQIRHLMQLMDEANGQGWFEDLGLPPIELPLSTPVISSGS